MCLFNSKNGLISHEFFEPGIFYFSDQTLTEAASYFGTIIVKPKIVERFIELTPEGFHEGQASDTQLLTYTRVRDVGF